jgi:pimeloyl-ACP methyl ester carboxylesterase
VALVSPLIGGFIFSSLRHGFPSSSHMFRNLIPLLADKYHVVAPDFPGYGESSAPSVNHFDYSFEGLAAVTETFTEKLNLSSYALYLSDIGASVGFRLAVMHPERVTAMVVQNGGAHVEAINITRPAADEVQIDVKSIGNAIC